jgi:hypothetical protein
LTEGFAALSRHDDSALEWVHLEGRQTASAGEAETVWCAVCSVGTDPNTNFSTAAAELLLGRMQAKIEGLCDERDRLRKEEGGSTKGRVLGGRSW